jgi:hypothetical protein
LKPPRSNTRLDRRVVIKIGLTTILFTLILALALNRDFYNDSMISAYLSLALASAVIVLAMIRRSSTTA